MGRYFSEIWRLRHFWWALVRIDLRNRYRRSMIGVGWSLLQPIAMTVVLCTVFSQLFHADVRTYAPFLLAGLTFWSFLVAVTNQGCQCFFVGESYIRQQSAPLAIYPLRTTLGAGIHLLLGLGVVILSVWCLQGFDNLPALASLVPALVLVFLFGWSLAVCTGVMNVLFQDTQHLVEVLLQILFYVTPILYSDDLLRRRGLEWFLHLNPLAPFLELIRRPILQGEIAAPDAFVAAAAAVLLAGGAAMLTLSRIERRMIFYL